VQERHGQQQVPAAGELRRSEIPHQMGLDMGWNGAGGRDGILRGQRVELSIVGVAVAAEVADTLAGSRIRPSKTSTREAPTPLKMPNIIVPLLPSDATT